MKPDPLSKLHDFYKPPAPSWMPQTIGWYVVFGLLLLLAAWLAWRVLANWRHNRYRREALRQLKYASVSEIPVLLKRTALAAWKREEVASLSGEPWLEFLNRHAAASSSSRRKLDEAESHLVELDYRGATIDHEQETVIRRRADEWIRRHRVRV